MILLGASVVPWQKTSLYHDNRARVLTPRRTSGQRSITPIWKLRTVVSARATRHNRLHGRPNCGLPLIGSRSVRPRPRPHRLMRNNLELLRPDGKEFFPSSFFSADDGKPFDRAKPSICRVRSRRSRRCWERSYGRPAVTRHQGARADDHEPRISPAFRRASLRFADWAWINSRTMSIRAPTAAISAPRVCPRRSARLTCPPSYSRCSYAPLCEGPPNGRGDPTAPG